MLLARQTVVYPTDEAKVCVTMMDIGLAFYFTVALAAMAKTVWEALNSSEVTGFGLCLGLAVCVLWLPAALLMLCYLSLLTALRPKD